MVSGREAWSVLSLVREVWPASFDLSGGVWPVCLLISVREAWPVCLLISGREVWPRIVLISGREAWPFCLSFPEKCVWLHCLFVVSVMSVPVKEMCCVSVLCIDLF